MLNALPLFIIISLSGSSIGKKECHTTGTLGRENDFWDCPDILLVYLPGWENIGKYHMTFGIPLGHLTNYWLLRSTKYVPAADIGVNKIECLNTTCPLVVKCALAHSISFHIKYIQGPVSII